jgi:hypothetical protein
VAIRTREAAVSNVRVAVTGTLDGTPERFTAFTMDVSTQCPDPELARKLITMAGARLSGRQHAPSGRADGDHL